MSHLNIEEVSIYFPYNVQCELLNYKSDYVGEKYGFIDEIRPLYLNDQEITCKWHIKTSSDSLSSIEDIKLLLKPFCELTNQENGHILTSLITHGFHNSFWREDNFDVKHLYQYDFRILLKNHFDLFNLIPRGLARDIKTINNEE